MFNFKNLTLLAIGIVLVVLWLPMGTILTKAILLVGLSIFLWATEAVPTWLTSFIFFLGGIIGHIAPADVILSGMTSSVVWLVLSGVILGASIKYTELDKVFARVALPFCEGSYNRAVIGVMMVGMIVMYLMPSTMGRIILLVPIFVAMAESLGYTKGEKEYNSIIVAGMLSTFLPGFYVLPSNVPNNVLAGSLQAIYNISYTYTDYWIDFFPILGVGKMVLIYVAIRLVYGQCRQPIGEAREKMAMTKEQTRLMVLLIVTILLWITEFIHHIPIGWVGMLSAIICFLPGLNFMPIQKPLRIVGFEPFFFVGGIISMSTLVKESGIADLLASQFISLINLWHPSEFMLLMMWIIACVLVCFISTVSGAPAIMTPLMGTVSTISAVPLAILTKMQILVYSNFLFFYQAPPMLVALNLEDFPKRDLLVILLFVSLMGYIVLGPISYFYWQLF